QTKLHTKIEDVMPWKLNGERWHRSDKGFPVGKKVQWDRGLLATLLDLLREVEPRLEIEWNQRSHINLRVPGVSHAWGMLRTKDEDVLKGRFVGKKGQFNLAALDGIGMAPEVQQEREHSDLLVLRFVRAEEMRVEKLRGVLKNHLSGFVEAFGGAT